MIANGEAARSCNADVIARPLMRGCFHVAMLISKGLLTRRVQQPGERTVETDPDLHVVVLALRLDVCEFFERYVKLSCNVLLVFINFNCDLISF